MLVENVVIPEDLVEPLFDLQAEDSLLAQLDHQVKNLPEREKVNLLKEEEVQQKEIYFLVRWKIWTWQRKKKLDLELASIETRLRSG